MIKTKREMYKKLAKGEFGNTIPQFFSVRQWTQSEDCFKYQYWGIRSRLVPGHPHTTMNIRRSEVPEYVQAHFEPDEVNISMMVDKIARVTAWLEVWQSTTGLVVEGVLNPDTDNGLTWRVGMNDPTLRQSWTGFKAYWILKLYMNENSYEDLQILLERYNDAIIEFSALDVCLGTVPHRNAIIWEVRNY